MNRLLTFLMTLGLFPASAGVHAATHTFDTWRVTNLFGVENNAVTADPLSVLGPLFTVNNIFIDTEGVAGFDYSASSWYFDVISGSIRTEGALCTPDADALANGCSALFSSGSVSESGYAPSVSQLVPVFAIIGEHSSDFPLNKNTFFFSELAVPLPGAAWLFGSAILGLAGLGRGRRQ